MTENCVYQTAAVEGRRPCDGLIRTAAGPLGAIPMASGHAWLVRIVLVWLSPTILRSSNAQRIGIVVVGMSQFRFSCFMSSAM
jgi:hypothetical protein